MRYARTPSRKTRKPRLLLCHNYYQQRGGEDNSFEDEVSLLRDAGHHVCEYTVHNDEIDSMTPLSAALKTVWNSKTRREISSLIEREQPDVMHCTNSFPLLSPSIHYAAKNAGIAVVQSLRNYRLLCPGGCLYRAARICEDCVGKKLPWPAIVHGCYRNNRAASAVTALAAGAHNLLSTWDRKVDMFLCPSEFTRQKYIQAGISSDRIRAIPNIVEPDPGQGQGTGNYAVFVGRLSAEKDLTTLIAAWRELGRDLPLRIIGDGPESQLVDQAQRPGEIDWLGRLPRDEALDIVGNAAVLIMPSAWYETFGRVIVEAFATGTPVVVSSLGAMAELVDDGRTGFHFRAGDPNDLIAKVRRMISSPENLRAMRAAVRREYETRYTASQKYPLLQELYGEAIRRSDEAQSEYSY